MPHSLGHRFRSSLLLGPPHECRHDIGRYSEFGMTLASHSKFGTQGDRKEATRYCFMRVGPSQDPNLINHLARISEAELDHSAAASGQGASTLKDPKAALVAHPHSPSPPLGFMNPPPPAAMPLITDNGYRSS